jgi:hypothetical protein
MDTDSEIQSNSYQQMSYQQSLDLENNTAADLEKLLKEDIEEDTVFPKDLNYSRGFALTVFVLALVSLGFIALSSPLNQQSLQAAGPAQAKSQPLVYPCKTTCENPCSSYKVRKNFILFKNLFTFHS